MYTSTLLTIFLSAGVAYGLVPLRGDTSLFGREPGNRIVNPAAVEDTVCISPGTAILSHDINVALLSICGGIQGKIQQCGGSPAKTTGSSGTAHFTLVATKGVIDITKGRWEACVAAARAVCGDSPFSSTCIGGAEVNAANVNFILEKQNLTGTG